MFGGGLLKWCTGGSEQTKDPLFEPSETFDEPANTRRVEAFEGQIARVNKAGRTKIKSQPIDLDEDFVPSSYEKTEQQRDFLRKILKRNFIFNGLSDKEMSLLIDAMQKEEASVGTTVIKQGDVGDFYYILENGTIDFAVDGKSVGCASRGEGFGELALLYDAPRAASCEAVEDSVLWKVDQKTFRTLLARQSKDNDGELMKLIDKISLFKHLDLNEKTRFIDAMTSVRWKQNARIVQKGSVGNVFYIIQEGQVKVHDIGGGSSYDDLVLGPGGFFGERALLTGELRAANVTALTEVKTLAMDRETFEKAIGPLQKFLDLEMRKQFLQSIPLFSHSSLKEQEMDQLARLMDEICYLKGQKLSTEGQSNEMILWVIRHGKVEVSGEGGAKTLKSGDYYGDQILAGDTRNAGFLSCAVVEPITAWVLRRSDFESVIGDIGRLGKGRREKIKANIPFKELERINIIGRGGFGTVWLTRHKNNAYALKELSKRLLVDADQVAGTIREKEMLQTLRHPFILGMVSSYQDESKIYILMPIVPGGELFSVVQTQRQKTKNRGLEEYNVAFYAAGIIEALGYFHQHSIAYRDLKLENVLIDAEGYPVICDLGFAKKVVDKTYTLCGTPEYLAPEIIMSKGHDKAADYWSYGVLVYELFVSVTPFFRPRSSQLEMFKRIVSGQFTMPGYIDSQAAKLIRDGLLKRRPTERLGNLSRGYLDIKASDWFSKSGISWGAYVQKTQKAPWVPTVKNQFDSSNFDKFDDEKTDEMSLTPKEQELFKAF